MDSLTKEAVKDSGVSGRDVLRSKNFFALGLLAWLFTRPMEPTIDWVQQKFAKKPEVAAANIAAFKAGWNFGFTTEAAKTTFEVRPAVLRPGVYTNVTGNTALAWGLIAAAQCAKLSLFYGTYPITPASDILHELSMHKNFGVRTFQAEDEIAAIGSVIGASFAGNSRRHRNFRPGGGTEERGAVAGGHHRASPDPGRRPAGRALDRDAHQGRAVRPADGPVRSSWRGSASGDRDPDAVRGLRADHRSGPDRPQVHDSGDPDVRQPRRQQLRALEAARCRKPPRHFGALRRLAAPTERPLPALPAELETFARPWAIPGTTGLEHRIGGIEKEAVTGNVSYDPGNHQLMTDSRAWKIANIANDIAPVEVRGRRRRDPGAGLGIDLRRHQGSRQPTPAKARRSPSPTCATSILSPKNLGEVVRAYPDGS